MVVCIGISLLFVAERFLLRYTSFCLFIHWRTFGLFSCLSTMNNADMSIHVYVFCIHVPSFFLILNLGVELQGHMIISLTFILSDGIFFLLILHS